MPMTQCTECVFWAPKQPASEGDCHRHAPAPYFGINPRPEKDFMSLTAWPTTQSIDICGEGEKKKGEFRTIQY